MLFLQVFFDLPRVAKFFDSPEAATLARMVGQWFQGFSPFAVPIFQWLGSEKPDGFHVRCQNLEISFRQAFLLLGSRCLKAYNLVTIFVNPKTHSAQCFRRLDNDAQTVEKAL